MIERELFRIAFEPDWGRQMRFICGPRQAGKTTLARQQLDRQQSAKLYYLWDLRSVRNRYKDNELFFTGDAPMDRKNAWVCFDEIHKMPAWKNILKAVFDSAGERFHFIVTGSAKLNVLRHAGDSLAGRYFTFHLLPLTLREVIGHKSTGHPHPKSAQTFVTERLADPPADPSGLEALLHFGGFPEPFLRHSKPFHRKWALDYVDTVIREDIGTLTRIIDREHVHDLYRLLPETTGSPISENSLAAHLQVSPITVKNYLRRLEDFYLGFSVPPYSRNIKRALLKSRKFYLFDWTTLRDEGKRYETFVACQLRARLSLWNDTNGDTFDLFYVRNKEKQETDFLIVREGKPWMLIETKLSDGPVDKHHQLTSQSLGNIPLVQLCRQDGIAAQQSPTVYRISANRLLN